MIKTSISGPAPAQFRAFERMCRQRLEQAALKATDQGAKLATSRIRTAMAGAGLGRLGNAIVSSSDQQRVGRVHLRGDGFSASGAVHLRSRSERAAGAVEAYTRGATIRPKRGGWLWIPSPDLQRRVKGGLRMTPQRYRSSGMEQRLGPLIEIPGRHAGEALLVVKSVTTRTEGRANPRQLPKSGRVGKGRRLQDQFIAFIGIKSTARQARVDASKIIAGVQAEMPTLLAQAMES